MDSAATTDRPLSLFYSYSHKDEDFRSELGSHLSFLRRMNLAAEWHDRMIGAGDDWKRAIDLNLASADIILLLVSADFIASDYCWGEEMAKALAKHRAGKARVIPVILRPCHWTSTPIGRLQAVPKDGSPVSEWTNRDAAFYDIAVAVEGTIQELHEQRRRAAEEAQREAAEARQQAEATAAPADAPKPKPPSQPRRRGDVYIGVNPRDLPDVAVFKDFDEPWCPEMVLIPKGSFVMGSADDEEGREKNEGPQHRVTFDCRFALGRYSVTFEQYDHFCVDTGREKPSDDGAGRGRHPVINVSWQDAAAYCVWFAKASGKSYRLPSEAEWEYACRAGTTTRYSFGDKISRDQANFVYGVWRNFGTLLGSAKTADVGSYLSNPWGLYEMHGNVWEWVEDCWHHNYQDAPQDGSARGSDNPAVRVARGGSWDDFARLLRSAARNRCFPVSRNIRVGFRLAMTLTP